MNTNNADSPLAFMDWHTHVLPAMDDGAADLEESLNMLRLLKRQHVRTVVASSHYIAHKEPVEAFVRRRGEALDLLKEAIARRGAEEYPELLAGAEIYLERSLTEMDLSPLCVEGTDALMVEMPRQSYRSWMSEAIWDIGCNNRAIPVVAHIDRYLSWYGKKDYQELLEIPDCIFQVNTEAFLSHSPLKFVLQLVKNELPMILGSDCHNMGSRPPDWDKFRRILDRRRDEKNLLSFFLDNSNALFSAKYHTNY